MNKDYMMELQALEQEANNFAQQLQIVDQQIEELKVLKENISNFDKTKEKEIYSEFGKGIYFKSKIDKKEVLVDVGSKVLVPKTLHEVKEIIDEQIDKFSHIKPEISKNIENINHRVDMIVKQVRDYKMVEEKKPTSSEKVIKNKKEIKKK